MIYRSNLVAPDLSAHFKLLVKPRPWSLGHSIPSDPDYEPDCCFMSHDEAAILYHCAKSARGPWVDVGSRFGWTAKHINWITNDFVACLDPHFMMAALRRRFLENVGLSWSDWTFPFTLRQYADSSQRRLFSGFCIDGNHDDPEPLRDAMAALTIAAPKCCMAFHDFRGRPIRDAVRYLMGQGFKARVYWTPAMMAVCWRGDFTPPVHERDPNIDWMSVRRAAEIDSDFDLSRCE